MRRAQVTTGWSFNGMQALVLRNTHLTVVILPELGGKVWQIHDRTSDREFLWHHPRVPAGRVPFGSTFDDVFHGGWDELFPNDVPETLGGEPYPDHGEVWSIPWQWSVLEAGPDAAVRLWVNTPISACSLEKTITLAAGARHLRIDSQLRSNSRSALPYLWKQHLALRADEPARIHLPAGPMLMEDFGSPRAGGPGTRYTWPVLDGEAATHDMSITLPPTSRVSEFQYATAVDAGWCALSYGDGVGIGLAFDAAVFPSCWLFASYGGWRDLEVVILEPCTGYPVSVADGVAHGTHRTLGSGEVISTSMTLAVFDGLSDVSAIDAEGTVSGRPR